jgi:DNA invertase Pin-like site-specific DNA recombinase
VPVTHRGIRVDSASENRAKVLKNGRKQHVVNVGTVIDRIGRVIILNTMTRRRAPKSAAGAKVVAYVRVSTAKQADKGESLETQEAKVRGYAALYGLDIVEVVVDAGASAKTLDRPGIKRVLDMIAAGEASGLLVSKLDRLTRSVRDLGTLINTTFAKADLFSVSEQVDTRSASGRLVLNVLSSVSQWEREIIAERTSEVMQHMRANGEYTGGSAPYGFRLEDGALVNNDAEQETIMRARELRNDGERRTLRAVASILAAEGHLARNGGVFSAQSIKNMTDVGAASAA